MASTGTASYTITRDALSTAALRALRIIDPEVGTPSTNMLTNAAEAMNILLKHWSVKGLKLWCYQTVVVPMVIGKRKYTLGPSGADVTCIRPLRVLEYGNFLRDTSCGCGGSGQGDFDIALRLISRAEYREFGYKFAQGLTNSIYYNPTINIASGATSPSLGWGELWVYVTANDTDHAIYLNCQRPIYDMTSANDEFDLPQEWFNAIKWGLAAEIADEYEVSEQRIMRLNAKAEQALELCTDWSVEEASTTFAPDMSGVR
jgi:hypothetical protein